MKTRLSILLLVAGLVFVLSQEQDIRRSGSTVSSGGGGTNGITALTGDGTASGPGSAALTLKSVGAAGTYGDSSHFPVVTTDAQGRVTAVATNLVVGGTVGTMINTGPAPLTGVTMSSADGSPTNMIPNSPDSFFIMQKVYRACMKVR